MIENVISIIHHEIMMLETNKVKPKYVVLDRDTHYKVLGSRELMDKGMLMPAGYQIDQTIGDTLFGIQVRVTTGNKFTVEVVG